MKTKFYFRNNNQCFRIEIVQNRSNKQKEWKFSNQEKIKIFKKQNFQRNKEKIKESHKPYSRKRRGTDFKIRFLVITRNRIHKTKKGISES